MITQSSLAQNEEPPVSLYTSVGIALPVASKTFRQYYKAGSGFSEGLVIKLMDRLSLRTTIDYHWYNFKKHDQYYVAVVYPKKYLKKSVPVP